VNNTDNPEVLAVVPLPSAVERRHGEVMLVRVKLRAPQTGSLHHMSHLADVQSTNAHGWVGRFVRMAGNRPTI
jgi:hypothetical protein